MIETAVTKITYQGDGETTQFPFSFPYNDGTDVKAAIYDTATEIETVLTSDYYVDTVANKVIYPGYPAGEEPPLSERPPVLPVGKNLTVFRSTPISQLEDLGDKYPLPIVEDMVDKNTMILQEANEKLSRAVLVDMGGGITPQDVASDIKHLKEYRDAAESAKDTAVASAAAAALSETNAAVSETNAAASETNAAASAAAALASKTAAATSATNAAASEANALSSQNAAAASETAARSSEVLSATSEAHAATSADAALSAASVVSGAMPQILNAAASAGASATAAQASETAAALSAGTATAQAGIATDAAEDAADSATAAAASAAAAANSAGAAATSATEAATANTEAKYYAKITMDKVAESAVGYPSQSGTLTYDGTEQSPTWDVFYEPNKMTVTGTTAATDAGTYTITMTPKPTYYWWDTGTTAARTQTWTIGRQAIANVPSQSGAVVYDGTEQSPSWTGYDSTKMTIGGTTAATEAGTYTATFTPTANYQWSDGTTTAKEVTWTISALSVTPPTVTDTAKTYNGSAQSPTISTYNPAIIEVTGDSATNVGSYTVTFHLKNASMAWSDDTTADKTVAWSIAAKAVTIPTVTDTTKTYNGTAQGPTISAYDTDEVAVSGNATATNAGSYTVTFSLTSITNYKWSDDTTAAKSTNWSIAKAAVSVPSVTNTSKTYNRSSQSPTISAYDNTVIAATGDLSATNAGTYTITFSLIYPANYMWTDTTTTAKTATWTIAKKVLTPPYLTNDSKTYNGNSQSPTQNGYTGQEDYISRTGTQSATNAGTYTITYSLKYATNTIWSDDTTAAKNCTWTIAKAAGSLSISPTTISLNTSKLTDTITVTRAGDGTISAVSSDTSIATVSVSGTTVTVTAVANGSATVTVSVAVGTNYLAPSDATASVAVSLISNVLDENSWETISQVAQAGTGENYWDVGDVKMIELNGKIGNYFTASNLSIGVFILDFNHVDNNVAENNIIFGGFKSALTSGKDIALCDAFYGKTLTSGSKAFSMNHWYNTTTYGSNYGGWKGSDLRYDILGATSTPPLRYGQIKVYPISGYDATFATLANPVADTFLAALPFDLRRTIRLRTHYVNNTGNSSTGDGSITAVADAVSLLAEFEIFGKREYANPYEKNHQAQMAYYANGNATVRYKNPTTSTAVNWWGCSPSDVDAIRFCFVNGRGVYDRTDANGSHGLAPVFKV